MAELVLENGLVDVGGGEFRRADVVVVGDRIALIGKAGARPAAETLDCSRYAVAPGMVNAQSHSNENWFRGRFDNLPLEPWMLFSYPVLAAPAQSAGEIYVRTLLGALEMVRSGTTSVVDFLYEVSGFTDESLAAVVQAYRDVGLRALVALAMSDLTYHETVVLDIGMVPAGLLDRLERERPPAWSEWERFARSAVDRFHRPEEGISIGLAPSGPQRCSDELLSGCAELADELDLAIHIHVLETRMQALSGRKRYGCTLLEHLDVLGFLGLRVIFEHGLWHGHRPQPHLEHEARQRHLPGAGAPAGRRQRRARLRRDVVERRKRHVRHGQGRRAPPQALGDRLPGVARRTGGLGHGHDRRHAADARRDRRSAGAGRPRGSRPARSGRAGVHAAQRPAQADGPGLGPDRAPLDDGRWALGAARWRGDGGGRGGDPVGGASARPGGTRPPRRGIPGRPGAARRGQERVARGAAHRRRHRSLGLARTALTLRR